MVFCGISHKDGVIHVDIVVCLFELWRLSSLDGGGIEWHRGFTESQSAHA